MTYKDLLDFKDQRIVDEVYRRVKNEENSEEIDLAYQEITERNQTKIQTAQYQYNQVMDKVSQILGIIGMMIFAFLFIFLGSIILSIFIGFINITFIEAGKGLYNFLCGIGAFILENIMHISVQELIHGAKDYATMPSESFPLYVTGMSCILIITFTVLYILSFFKKVEKKALRQLSVGESHHYLQTNEDDDWSYIRGNFERRMKKRRKRDFFEIYYQSYINLFYQYQEVNGTIQDLEKKEQVKLIFFTIVNTIKNIMGSFSAPIYFSIAIMIAYYQNFTYTNLFTLEIFLSALPFGKFLFGIIEKCHSLIMFFPCFHIFNRFKLEFAQVASFCICYVVVYFVWDVIRRKIRESQRQYHRRLNYYLKKKQGMYEEKKKYTKAYNYSIQFVVFVLFIGALCGMKYLDVHYSPLNFMDSQQKEDAEASMAVSDDIYEKIDQYAIKNKVLFQRTSQRFTNEYIYVDGMGRLDFTLEPYLKVYTFYNEDEAINAVGQSVLLGKNKLKTDKKTKAQYFYNDDGFIIRDKAVVIIMKNKEDLIDHLFTDDMVTYNETQMGGYQILSQKELRNIMKGIGYNV